MRYSCPRSNKSRKRQYSCFFFFFQAEDGIRDLTVTGVQTCALPISAPPGPFPPRCPASGADEADRALGLGASMRADPRMAGSGPFRPQGRRETLCPAALGGGRVGGRSTNPRRVGPRVAPPRAGADRGRLREECRDHRLRPQRPSKRGGADLAERLWRAPFVPELPQAFTRGLPQDRPDIRARHRRGPCQRCHCAGCDIHGARDGPRRDSGGRGASRRVRLPTGRGVRPVSRRLLFPPAAAARPERDAPEAAPLDLTSDAAAGPVSALSAGDPAWSRRRIPIFLGLAAVYFAAGKLGLAMAFANPSASPVWPPTAIAFAAFLVLGYRVWPAIFLGAFLVNATTTGGLLTSAGIAVGNTLEGVAGAWLTRRWAGGCRAFERAQGVFAFAVLAGGAAATISATAGVTSLALGGGGPRGGHGSILRTGGGGGAPGAGAGGAPPAPLGPPPPRWRGQRATPRARAPRNNTLP